MVELHQALRVGDPEVFALIEGEQTRQQQGIELIPSENYTYPEVLRALGSVLTNKYSEGYPGKRYYGGQKFTDAIEELACQRARDLFRAEHANVQPLSGSPMNQAVYLGLLEPGDTILAMDLSHGGHLTHGAPVSHMGRIFRFERYRTISEEQGRVDFDELLAVARRVRPKLVVAGTTSSPRQDDFASFKRVADEVGAFTMADVSHVGGLIAGGVLRNPLDDGFDVMTTTTHKSLRGPRGGMILCRKKLAKRIDKSVFPGLQGGPHMNVIAGIAIALGKAQSPDFRCWARQVLANARAMEAALLEAGVTLVTGGGDNHMLVIDCEQSFGMDGRRVEEILDVIGIATNKQIVPDDPRPPLRPTGIRIGSPAATTRGMLEEEMRSLVAWMLAALRSQGDESALAALRENVQQTCLRFPVPGL